ncbi:MAG: hypothetical protein JWQ49_2409 [Edaphobacter sp.]|nr:hypothetical protein [Edaphobacter sp.]
MKTKSWADPTKRPAKQSTMNTEGDFGKFTDLMRKLVSVPHSEMTRRLEAEKKNKGNASVKC